MISGASLDKLGTMGTETAILAHAPIKEDVVRRQESRRESEEDFGAVLLGSGSGGSLVSRRSGVCERDSEKAVLTSRFLSLKDQFATSGVRRDDSATLASSTEL